MAQPKCPFCLGRHDFKKSSVCPEYKLEVPATYINEYDRVPPLWLMTLGFTKHGKTCYLAALTMMLENVNRVWPETAQNYPDQYTFDMVRETRRQAQTGDQPAATQRQPVLRPLLIPMYDVPNVGSQCLVLYDTPGELFENLQSAEDMNYIRPLKEVRNIWFLISLWDLQRESSRRISDLFTIYLSGMQLLKWPLTGRNLIVVYTKADKVREELPQRVEEYLLNDPFRDITNYSPEVMVPDMADFSLKNYIQEMQAISTELEDFTRRRIPGGGAFIGLARRHEMGLFFTVTSALGSAPDGNRQWTDATRYRVLDPYLWALYLNKPTASQSIKLVLDGAKDSDQVYDFALGGLVERLSELGEVTTHYLGQQARVSVAGQAPPSKKPAKPRVRLIGPLLERTEPKTKVVAVVGGPIRDLEDFNASTWRDRLLLIAVGDEPYQDWPNTITVRSKDGDLEAVYEECKRLLQTQPAK
jgi:hypothetical protein